MHIERLNNLINACALESGLGKFAPFALSAGNHEMRRHNAGMAGYKLAGVKALRKQMDEAARPIYRGGSSYVQS